MQNIFEISDLKHLNLSNNQFTPKDVSFIID